MIAVDSNILVYAHRSESPFHFAASRCLHQIASQGVAWAIPWPCMHEFLSVVTNPRIYKPSTPIEIALQFGDSLLASPQLSLIAEGEHHWADLKATMIVGGAIAGLVHDARIAAICIQHGLSELWTADRDFGRFPRLRVVNPLVGA